MFFVKKSIFRDSDSINRKLYFGVNTSLNTCFNIYNHTITLISLVIIFHQNGYYKCIQPNIFIPVYLNKFHSRELMHYSLMPILLKMSYYFLIILYTSQHIIFHKLKKNYLHKLYEKHYYSFVTKLMIFKNKLVK